MKNVLRSTFGTLVVAAFLAIAPPTYARGGHGGGHGGHRGHAGGHAVRGHAAAGHVRGGHAGFRARGARGHLCCAGRARTTRALQVAHIIGMAAVTGEAVTGEAITGIRPMDILGSAITAWAMAIHTTDIGYYGYRYGGYIRTTDYYPYRYGYWPSVTFSFGY